MCVFFRYKVEYLFCARDISQGTGVKGALTLGIGRHLFSKKEYNLLILAGVFLTSFFTLKAK